MWSDRKTSDADRITVCPSSRILALEELLQKAERQREEAVGEVVRLRRELRLVERRLELATRSWWRWWRWA
jgi:hypothetical protein